MRSDDRSFVLSLFVPGHEQGDVTMGRYTRQPSGLSDLESQLDEEFEFLVGEDEEIGDDELELETEFENLASESDEEFEEEFEGFEDEAASTFGERFYELSQREWESEYELDTAIDQVLGEMEREYFFSRIVQGIKKGGRALLKKGMAYAKRNIPAFQALKGVTQLARGDMGGLLRSLAKAGLASAVPGGAAALPALKALGFETSQDQESEREAWENFAGVAADAYETLADSLTPNADHPLEASRLANAAFATALARRTGMPRRAGRYGSRRGRAGGRRIRVTASRGDTVIVRIT
jgi:hypothetical protein